MGVVLLKMNKKLTEFIGYFSPENLKNDRRIIIFAVCLLIATMLWFLNALGKDYTTTLTYSVKYVNPPKNLFLANAPPSKLELNVQAHGFTLLRHKLAFSFSPIVLDLTTISQNMNQSSNEILVPSEVLIRRIGTQISKEISVNEVSPPVLSLVFDSLETKVIPVIPRVSTGFKPQFFLKGIIAAKPDSIKISGPAGILDTLTFVYTENRTFSGLEASAERILNVIHPRNTSISPEKVTVHIPVEKFTEKELTLPVKVINNPDDVELKLFPPQVSVLFLVGLSEYENVTASIFTASVDYNQVRAGDATLVVTVETQQPFIQLMKVSPNSVEYLIETNN